MTDPFNFGFDISGVSSSTSPKDTSNTPKPNKAVVSSLDLFKSMMEGKSTNNNNNNNTSSNQQQQQSEPHSAPESSLMLPKPKSRLDVALPKSHQRVEEEEAKYESSKTTALAPPASDSMSFVVSSLAAQQQQRSDTPSSQRVATTSMKTTPPQHRQQTTSSSLSSTKKQIPVAHFNPHFLNETPPVLSASSTTAANNNINNHNNNNITNNNPTSTANTNTASASAIMQRYQQQSAEAFVVTTNNNNNNNNNNDNYSNNHSSNTNTYRSSNNSNTRQAVSIGPRGASSEQYSSDDDSSGLPVYPNIHYTQVPLITKSVDQQKQDISSYYGESHDNNDINNMTTNYGKVVHQYSYVANPHQQYGNNNNNDNNVNYYNNDTSTQQQQQQCQRPKTELDIRIRLHRETYRSELHATNHTHRTLPKHATKHCGCSNAWSIASADPEYVKRVLLYDLPKEKEKEKEEDDEMKRPPLSPSSAKKIQELQEKHQKALKTLEDRKTRTLSRIEPFGAKLFNSVLSQQNTTNNDDDNNNDDNDKNNNKKATTARTSFPPNVENQFSHLRYIRNLPVPAWMVLPFNTPLYSGSFDFQRMCDREYMLMRQAIMKALTIFEQAQLYKNDPNIHVRETMRIQTQIDYKNSVDNICEAIGLSTIVLSGLKEFETDLCPTMWSDPNLPMYTPSNMPHDQAEKLQQMIEDDMAVVAAAENNNNNTGNVNVNNSNNNPYQQHQQTYYNCSTGQMEVKQQWSGPNRRFSERFPTYFKGRHFLPYSAMFMKGIDDIVTHAQMIKCAIMLLNPCDAIEGQRNAMQVAHKFVKHVMPSMGHMEELSVRLGEGNDGLFCWHLDPLALNNLCLFALLTEPISTLVSGSIFHIAYNRYLRYCDHKKVKINDKYSFLFKDVVQHTEAEKKAFEGKKHLLDFLTTTTAPRDPRDINGSKNFVNEDDENMDPNHPLSIQNRTAKYVLREYLSRYDLVHQNAVTSASVFHSPVFDVFVSIGEEKRK